MNGAHEVAPNGHLQVIGGRGNRRWRAFWWDADGKHSRVLGMAWAQNSGKRTPRGAIIWHSADGRKPNSSYLTPKEAEVELRRLLEHEAVRLPTPRKGTGELVTFADAAEAWLRHGERKRNLKRSTLRDYRQVLDTYLLPLSDDAKDAETPYGRAPFATMALRDLRPEQVKAWYDGLPYGRTTEKLLMVTRAIFAHARTRAWIGHDPTDGIERHQVQYSGDYDFYSREDIDALVGAAANHQDAAVFRTAAMTGLRRGELVALRWRDIDFRGQAIRVRANYSFGQLVTPKSGKIRSVPLVPQVAQALASLGQREHFTRDDDPVFVGQVGQHMDASALRRRYTEAVKRAGLRPLPFHSLRHYFGSAAVNRATLVQVQAWMGHAHIQTTARYLHAKSQADDAALLATAFAQADPQILTDPARVR
ncbi:MAG: site-specific integrase [Actinomycetota bacterium]|nr:site-specific integrase [Actinomycetota bacterium]